MASTHLQGFDAVTWLAERGLAVLRHVRPFHVIVDEVQWGDFALRRMWLPSCSLAQQGVRGQRGVSALFLLDGGLEVSSPAGEREGYRAGEAFVHETTRRTEIEVPHSTAFIQMTTAADRLLVTRSAEPVLDIKMRPTPELLDPFVAFATSVLNRPLAHSSLSTAAMRRAAEAMLSAMVVEADPLAETGLLSRAQRTLLEGALAYIEGRLSDPSLSLADMAQGLAVSKTHLIRVFRATGTTPMRYLRQRRSVEALVLLRSSAHLSRTSAREAVAEQTGFVSVRAMLDALRREHGDVDV